MTRMKVGKNCRLQGAWYDGSVMEEYYGAHCNKGLSVWIEIRYFVVPILPLVLA